MENGIIAIVLLGLLSKISSINYVYNGGFELPTIAYDSDIFQGAEGWDGSTYQVMNRYRTLGHQQYIDLSGQYGANGYIQQEIFLPDEGLCNLSFLQQANTTYFDSYVMEVYWNGQLIVTQIANTTDTTFQSFAITGKQGSNLLSFQQVGDPSDWTGMYLDEISVTCEFLNQTQTTILPNETLVQQPVQIEESSEVREAVATVASIAFSTAMNQARGLNNAYLLAEDLWLYHYDKVEHEGVLNMVFNASVTIELMKLEVLDKFLHFQKYKDSLPISNYSMYTSRRFLQIQGSSTVLITAVFPFFIYNIPQNILICLIFYFLFILLHKFSISRYIRAFYFTKTALLQILIEGNVIYFAYVCFGHLSSSFYFQFGDKISLVFTVVFLWIVFSFTFLFYPLIGYLLKEQVACFLSLVISTNPGHFFLGFKNLARNFCRGAIFYFLHEFYLQQLMLLSGIELILIFMMVSFESFKKIFVEKIFFFYCLLYHLLFIFLNFSLYFSQVCGTELKPTAMLIQRVVIYFIILLTGIMVVTDLLPLNWFRSKCFRSNKICDRDIKIKTETTKSILKNSQKSNKCQSQSSNNRVAKLESELQDLQRCQNIFLGSNLFRQAQDSRCEIPTRPSKKTQKKLKRKKVRTEEQIKFDYSKAPADRIKVLVSVKNYAEQYISEQSEK